MIDIENLEPGIYLINTDTRDEKYDMYFLKK
jgi:hypothetical protein